MSDNIFFKKKNIKINKIYPGFTFKKNFLINDIKSLDKAKKNDITFFDSFNYVSLAARTQGSLCITTEKLKDLLPKNIEKVIVKNVLFELAKVVKIIYPNSEIDYPDLSLQKPIKKKI